MQLLVDAVCTAFDLKWLVSDEKIVAKYDYRSKNRIRNTEIQNTESYKSETRKTEIKNTEIKNPEDQNTESY